MRASLALLGMLAAGSPAVAQPRERPSPLAAVPTDSFAFVTVNVGKLWDKSDAKPLRDWMATQKAGTFERVFGVAPADIDRVTVFTLIADDDVDFSPVFLVTTRKPYTEVKLIKALGAGREKELERRGRVIELTEGKLLHWAVLVDEQTLLFASKSALRRESGAALVGHLLAPKKDGPLAAALADAAKHDVALGMDVRGLVEYLRGDPREKKLAPYLPLFKARTVTFTIDFDKTARGTLTLAFADAADAADAKRAAPVLKEGLAAVAEAFTKELARPGDALEPVERVFFETAVTLLKGAKVEAVGAEVIATDERPYQDVVAKFVAALPKSLEVSANNAKAMNNLKQLALGMHTFHDVNNAFPSDVFQTGDKSVALSWRVQVLPFLEQNVLWEKLDATKPWDDPANLKVLEAAEMPKFLELPGRPAPKGHTYFRILTLPKNAKGTDRPFLKEGEWGPTVGSISDGTSLTLMIVEAGEAVPWYKPDVLAYDGKLPLPPLGAKDADRFLAAFADGRVRALRPSKLGDKMLRALVTIAGGEVVDPP